MGDRLGQSIWPLASSARQRLLLGVTPDEHTTGEAAALAVDRAIQTYGGNGLSAVYGLAATLSDSRLSLISPVSRGMILNFISQHNIGLPGSY